MQIKKAVAFIAVLSMTGIMLTACGNSGNKTESTTTSATESQTTETTTESEMTETEISDESEPMEEANPLQPLVDAATASGEWPALMEVTDSAIISDYFNVDVTNESYEQYIFMQCPMSSNLSEIIIIKSADTETAKTALEGRQKKAQETDAFYPDDVERAGSSIVGVEGDYAYFIMCTGASDAETALVEAIKAL